MPSSRHLITVVEKAIFVFLLPKIGVRLYWQKSWEGRRLAKWDSGEQQSNVITHFDDLLHYCWHFNSVDLFLNSHSHSPLLTNFAFAKISALLFLFYTFALSKLLLFCWKLSNALWSHFYCCCCCWFERSIHRAGKLFELSAEYSGKGELTSEAANQNSSLMSFSLQSISAIPRLVCHLTY